MDQRKLIKLGNSSFAIALPKDWVDKSGLKKGDSIIINPNSNGELIIQSQYKKTNDSNETTLSLEGKKERDINREIIASYINGDNLINIKLDKKDLGIAKAALKNLFGIEIIESNHNLITAKGIIDLSSLSIDSITRRIDNSVRNIIEELEPLIKKGYLTKKEYEEIVNANKDVNRSYFLLCRLMVQGVGNPSILNTFKTNSSSLVYSWVVGLYIKKIGDSLGDLAEALSKNKLKKGEIEYISKLFEETKENFVTCLTAYHLKDKELSFKVTQNKDKTYSTCTETNKRSAVREICNIFVRIQHDIHHIARYIMDFIKPELERRIK